MAEFSLMCRKCQRVLAAHKKTVDEVVRFAKNEGWLQIEGRWHCPICIMEERIRNNK